MVLAVAIGEQFRRAAFAFLVIGSLAGCATEPRLPPPPQWPATWSGRQIFNTKTTLIYARHGSDADQLGHAVADVGREFSRRTGVQPPRGLLIVSDVDDSQFGALPPELLLPEKKKDKELLEMGFTTRELALAAPLPVEKEQLTGKMGFSDEAAGSVSWAAAVPSDGRTDQFIHHTVDAGLNKAKVNLAERIVLLPFMPMLNGMMARMLAAQRDIVIYQRFCNAESAWDDSRRKKEADDYAAARMKSLKHTVGATTRDIATEGTTRQAK